MTTSNNRFIRWLDSFGLVQRVQRGWILYDWANSAFATTVIAVVAPLYFAQVSAVDLPENLRTAYWGYANGIALLVVALLVPVLGATADYLGSKKRFLGLFAAFGIAATALLYFSPDQAWMYVVAMFVAGNIGFAGANVFYDSLLPHIASPGRVDRLSTAGFALGYVGGGLLLTLNVAWILAPAMFGIEDVPHAMRLSFLSAAIWWALFSIPLFRHVPEPQPRRVPGEAVQANPLKVGYRRLLKTFREVRNLRHAFVFLLAFWLYSDGIGTMIRMATVFASEIGIGTSAVIGALLMVQFVGIPATLAFGALADRIGAKRGLYLALSVYTLISILGYFMTSAWQFWLLALGVGLVQGGAQALSRSLYATMIPKGKSSEFFSFYSVSAKFAGILGPILFGVVSQITGNSRLAVLALIAFFVIGMLVLSRVDVDQGRHQAQQADEGA